MGLGLALAPVAVALIRQPGQGRRMAALLGLSIVVFIIGQLTGGLHYPVFASEGTWLSDELGATATLLPGWMPVAVPPALTIAVTIAAWASFLMLGASAARLREPRTGAPALWWPIAVLIVMTATLWLATDRYILAFIPPALPLILGGFAPVSWRRGAAVVGVYAAIGLVAVRDRINAEEAVWAAVNDLRQGGVPVSSIDAGYPVNGWLQYAHPEQAHRDVNGGVAVPFVNGDVLLPWVVAASPLPDTEVVREYTFARTGRERGSIFVLRRR